VAKVTITFEDGEPGMVEVHAECEPAIEKDSIPTGAQAFAMRAMEYVHQGETTEGYVGSVEDEEDGDDE